MRQLRYSVAVSLDGFIAGPQGEYDWIAHDPAFDFGALFRQFDTLLMGRRTFESRAIARLVAQEHENEGGRSFDDSRCCTA
jgi:dihydrofolate reductase